MYYRNRAHFGTNRKRICDFLLVSHCSHGPIFVQFLGYGDVLAENAYMYFSNPSLIRRSLFPLEFRDEVNH